MTELCTKSFLNCDDVCKIFDCCKAKAYEIINDCNHELEKKKFKTYSGKVLATYLFETYGMNDYLQIHKRIYEVKNV